MKRHVIVGDALLALTITWLFSALSGGTEPVNGLIVSAGTPYPLLMTYAQYQWFSNFWVWIFAVPMIFRRTFPRASAIAFVALCLVQMLFGPSLAYGDLFALAHLHTVIVTGTRRDARAFIAVAAGMSLIAISVNAVVEGFGPLSVKAVVRAGYAPCVASGGVIAWQECETSVTQQLLVFTAAILTPTLATIVMAYWQKARLRTVRLMRERNAALEARRQEETRIAALAERARIARDMHDVVAHTLSTIIVQADGGRFAGTHDIDLARRTMTTIKQESTRALHDMQHLLDSSDGDVAPTYDNIDGLVEQARAASPTWQLHRTIDGDPTPDDLGGNGVAAAYRLVQEALTNIRKYAGRNITVRIDEIWDDEGLHIIIVDDGRGSTASADGHQPGYGLIGMRERIEALGGSLHTGPRLGGGFEVNARIPFAGTRIDRHDSEFSGNRIPILRETLRSDIGKAEPDVTATNESHSRHDEAPHDAKASIAASSGFRQMLIETLGRARRSFRRQWRDEDSFADAGSNIVERMSRWTERHYLVMDAFYAALMLFLANSGLVSSEQSPGMQILLLLSDVIAVLPLIWRRRFPQASAFAFGVIIIVQAWLLPWFTPLSFATVLSLYSVTLYGRNRSVIWVAPMILVGSLSFAFKVTLMTDGINYPLLGVAAIAGHNLGTGASLSMSRIAFLLEIGVYAALTVLTCLAAVAAGKWSKSRESNLLVLQAREDALRQEEAKQKILAANMERNRISTNIQSDVTDTLRAVIARAEHGLSMLDEDPSPERISKAFETIASEGRAALKRMRQLLGVLRETGFSDETTPTADQVMPLSPVTPSNRSQTGQTEKSGNNQGVPPLPSSR
ncbi:sensor histidine kinase [Bifidobacterium margollesii]|nr:histidine kinase [Bifidobacterium margollesii]